ncbi:MAG TPA: hypothetical protein PKX23_00830 [Verrucomicrobiota bacterium]|nr:hypothetical protein [Verrucomicrobiota bacterium]HRT07875.1 hypothetical protein [Candidatus Paceibacterota bacterium]HRT56037.1 hypothetical protein [Candidatus Paceibacterota bacterium]
MKRQANESRRRRVRWWGSVTLVFATQLGLIFWLSDRSPLRTRPPAVSPSINLLDSGAENLLALQDATLFALPHQQGFSGPAWLHFTPPDFHPADPPDPPRWLALQPAVLGRTFQQLLALRLNADRPSPRPPLPELFRPALPAQRLGPAESELVVAGELAGQGPLAAIPLPPQPHADLLTNTVVSVVVDGLGQPVTTTLLAGSGRTEADRLALDHARQFRFRPLDPGLTPLEARNRLRWGELIFHWQTVPLPGTNTPPAS